MKIIYVIALLAFTLSAHGKEKVASKLEISSAMELTEQFYLQSTVKKREDMSQYTYKSENLNKFLYKWCVKKPQSDKLYFEKISAFCEIKEGYLLQNKWCLSNRDNSLKFYFELNNPALHSFELNFTDEQCNGKEELFVALTEYPKTLETNKPKTINCPYKPYPIRARNKEEGQVLVKVYISSNGVATNTEIVSSSTFPVLDDDAKKHYLRCQYMPEIKDGVPVEGMLEIKTTYRFGQE